MLQVLRTLVITLLVAGLLGAGIWLLQRGSTGLREPALEFMTRWWDGEPIREVLAAGFEDGSGDPDLSKLREFWKKKLGQYKGPGDVVSEDADEEGGGDLAILLHFEKKDATAYFRFVEDRGEWKLLRFRLHTPTDSAPESLEADAKKFATRLLELWATNETKPVWQLFSADLRRDLPATDFTERTRTALGEFGTLQGVQFVSSKKTGDGEVRMVLNVVFAGGPREARLTLLWRGTQLQVQTFHVDGLD